MTKPTLALPAALPWPLPAFGAWGTAWLCFILLAQTPLPAALAVLAALALPGWLAWHTPGLLRRVLLVAGFPVSALVQGQPGVPAWVWLLPLALLLALYPMRAWRDAPLFPTGARALDGLAALIGPAAPRRILDAGCGLGHGLHALRREWPAARLTGLEHSAPLALLARLRCAGMAVLRGDMWRHGWHDYDLVYLFQRPESMPRAWDKARREMRPGSWLVSLEFGIEGREPDLRLQQPGEREVLAWRIPAAAEAPSAPQPAARGADKAQGHGVTCAPA